VRVELQTKDDKHTGRGTADDHGRWRVTLDRLPAGGPYQLSISGNNKLRFKNVYVGEVWVCSGQSNMQWPLAFTANAPRAIANSANPKIRLFTVPMRVSLRPRRNVQATWVECGPKTVGGFSAVAYFFGRDLQKALGVPVGLIHTSWGGTVAEAWTSGPALAADPDLKYLAERGEAYAKNYPKMVEKYFSELERYLASARQVWEQKKELVPAPNPPVLNNPNIPTVLYNGMIAPLIPFAMRGVIWYQGESNAGRAYEYRTLLPAMIKDWRHHWKQGDFPFLIVQLAPFGYQPGKPQENSAWAELREAQLLTALKVPKTGLAVITDVGDARDIHPRKKAPVGARLALAARAIAYKEKIVYSGPIYDKKDIEGNKVILSFKHVGGGLTRSGDKLLGFTICGKDHKFVNAGAEIKGDQVVVSSPDVSEPVAVRYAWADCPVANLQNKEGLPAAPFRTDDFPMVTAPKKPVKPK
jgi:sialate O-acetylesterase